MPTCNSSTLTVDLVVFKGEVKHFIYPWVLEKIAKEIRAGKTCGTVRACNWELKKGE